jgi:predicted AlkP superfamily phosphohydrolase/phosphomutase
MQPTAPIKQTEQRKPIKPKKVFVIGLDAATLDVINPLMAEGRLPTLQRLSQEGACGELASTIHPLSPPAWTSFITGKNPGKHGIYDFVVHKRHSYELEYTYGGMRKGKSLWRLLSDAGKKVVVLNVPMTYPPEAVNGVLISGFDAPGTDSDFAYPPAVLDEIERNIGPYQLRDYPQGQNPDSFLQQLEELLAFRRRLTRYMMEHYEWDFFMMVFGETDLVQHAYWQYTDPAFTTISESDRKKYGSVIRDTYVKMDGVLGELLAKVSDDTHVLVMSDHGAGPAYKAVFINKWLEEQGFLSYVGSKGKSWHLELLKKMHHTIKNTIPPAGLEWMKRTFPQVRQQIKSKIVFSDIDWAHTKVWSFGRESTNLFINLKDKFPQGIVTSGQEYEDLRDSLIAALKTIIDPDTREPAVAQVLRGEEVYHGDCTDNAPDLLVTWRNHAYTSWPGYNDRERELFEPSLYHSDFSDWSELQKGGNHRPNGILFMKGAAVKEGCGVQNARIIDLAPTILYLMGTPVPMDMDGRVLEEALDANHLKQHPPEHIEPPGGGETNGAGPAYSDEDAARVEERLRSLGYIE